jgi:hypothetical protein
MDSQQRPLTSEFLFHIDMEALPGLDIGKTPRGWRRIDRIKKGWFEGPRIKGTVVTATDHLLVMRDNTSRPDVRAILQADDGTLIQMTYQGIVAGPEEQLKKLGQRQQVDPATYYMRNAIFFETAIGGPHAWLNSTLAVGLGAVRIQEDKSFAVRYTVHRIL